MKNDHSYGRAKKFRKKRNSQYLFVSILVPLLLGIVILSIKIFVPIVNPKSTSNTAYAKQEDVQATPSTNAATKNAVENEYEMKYKQIVDSYKQNDSQNPNVISSTVKEWHPIGTAQPEPHKVSYNHHSKDFYEMEDAAAYATELTKQDFSVWHIGKGYDDQSVKVYIATNDLQYHYVVYLHWEINKGWLPILVEEVKGSKY